MLCSDIRYALRCIAHRPRTSAIVALTLARVLSGFLFGVSATDPATFAAAVGFVLVAAAVATAVPARAAARVDPLSALRQD
jgi:putative ABC transport system permease protein